MASSTAGNFFSLELWILFSQFFMTGEAVTMSCAFDSIKLQLIHHFAR